MNPQGSSQQPGNPNQAPLPPAQSAPPQQPPPYVQPVPQPEGYPPQSYGLNPSKKLLIIAVSVLLAVVLGLLLFLVFRPDNSDSSKQSAPNTSAPSNSSIEATNQKPLDGYVPYDSSCYTIQLPTDNNITYKNDCAVISRFGAEQINGINVRNFTKYRENLDSNANYLKEIELKTGTLVSEEDIKVGGVPAKKLIFKGNGQYGLTTLHVLVETEGYSIDGVKVSGLEIVSTNYDQADVKTVIDNILAFWQWK